MTAGSNEFTLTASSLTAFGLVYSGTATVRSGSASVTVLQFTMSGASLAGFDLTGPCIGGHQVDTTVGAGSMTALTGSITLAVSSLDGSLGGVPLSFTAAQPPLAPFPSQVTLTGVTIVAVEITAAQAQSPGLITAPGAC